MAADQRLLPFTLCFTLCLVFSCSLFSSPAHHNYYYPSLFFNSSTLPTLDLHPHTPYRLRLSDCASRHSCLAPPFLHRTCVDVSPPPPPTPLPPCRASLVPLERLLRERKGQGLDALSSSSGPPILRASGELWRGWEGEVCHHRLPTEAAYQRLLPLHTDARMQSLP